jgi:hypothetical protein
VSAQHITQSSITSDTARYFVQVTDKAGWPWLIDARSTADPARRPRVRNAFPDLTDQDLMLYFDPRRVFAA